MRNKFPAAIAMVALVSLIGCGSSSAPDGLKNLVAVSGVLKYKGEPANGAEMILYPEGTEQNNAAGAPITKAIVGEDGTFVVQTVIPQGTGNGATPGTYLASISWRKPTRPHDPDSDLGPESLPKKYQDPKQSGVKIEILRGARQLEPIELTP